MNYARSTISKLMTQISLEDIAKENLQSMPAKNISINLGVTYKDLLQETRRLAFGPDLAALARDEFLRTHNISLAAERIEQKLSLSEISAFANSVQLLTTHNNSLVTQSYFTQEAQKIAAGYSKLEFSGELQLQSLISSYLKDRDLFISSLLLKAQTIVTQPKIRLRRPSPDEIEKIDPKNISLEPEQQRALIAVDGLPLRVIAQILRSPHEVRNITPRQFEEFVAEILTQLGFADVLLTPRSRDGGKDIIASHRVNGIPLSFYFECKQYANNNRIQLATLRALLGTIAHDSRNVNKGVLVTTSTFTRGSKEFLLAEGRLDGKDYDGLLGWINEVKNKTG